MLQTGKPASKGFQPIHRLTLSLMLTVTCYGFSTR
jgi:hypothetical protein